MYRPFSIIRRHNIKNRLVAKGARGEDKAKSLNELGIVNPFFQKQMMKSLEDDKKIQKTEDNKYYLKDK